MRHPIPRGNPITLRLNGRPVTAFEGETIAAVLLAEQQRVFRRTAGGQPRGLFCGMGICYDCLVTVNRTATRRACTTPVADGMVIDTGTGPTIEAGP